MEELNKKRLADLASRLFSRTKITWNGKDAVDLTPDEFSNIVKCNDFSWKPFLRSLKTMTDEEKLELKSVYDAEYVTDTSICFLEGGTLEEYLSDISFRFCSELTDWLVAHRFDCHGLIPDGNAIEAPDGMY